MSIPNVTYYIVPIPDYGWLYNKNALNGVSAEVLRIRFIWYGCFWTYQTTLSIYYSIFIMVFGITLFCAWRKIDFCVFVRILYICQISIHCYALHFKITLKPIIRVLPEAKQLFTGHKSITKKNKSFWVVAGTFI